MKKQIKEIVKKVKCLDKIEKISILNFIINNNESTLTDISNSLKLKESTVYKYLMEMKKAEFVNFKKLPGKKGKFIFSINKINLNIDSQTIQSCFIDNIQTKLIIFDVDDTLIRREDIPEQLTSAAKSTINYAKSKLQGKPISMPPEILFSNEWIQSKYGNSVKWYMSSWLSVAGISNSLNKERFVEEAIRKYFKNIEITAQSCKTFSDVIPFLKNNQDKLYFAAISNSSKKTILNTFKKNNLLKYFKKDNQILCIGSDDINNGENKIKKILKLANITPNNVIVVGDSILDITNAREANINFDKTIIINRNITPIDQIKSIKPNIKIIKNLNELKKII